MLLPCRGGGGGGGGSLRALIALWPFPVEALAPGMQVQPILAGYSGDDKIKAAPDSPGWGLGGGLTTPRRETTTW